MFNMIIDVKQEGGHASGRFALRRIAQDTFSSPQPRQRRPSGVSLLPSGPELVPPANTADSPSGQPNSNRQPAGTGTLRRWRERTPSLHEPSLGFGSRISTVSGYRGRRTPQPSPPLYYLPTAY